MVLSWNHFETNTTNTFRQQWNNLDFADVTLANVDYLQIRAHKMILSSCSPLFKNILMKNPHKNPLIYLKDIRYRELDMVMKFIYLGPCDVGE
jgi:hypothetical protein